MPKKFIKVCATLLILMSRHADRSSSSLYLADLRSCNMVVNLQPFVTKRDSIEVLDTEKTQRIRKLLALQYGKGR